VIDAVADGLTDRDVGPSQCGQIRPELLEHDFQFGFAEVESYIDFGCIGTLSVFVQFSATGASRCPFDGPVCQYDALDAPTHLIGRVQTRAWSCYRRNNQRSFLEFG
jgi:hypothetical protein